jgi:hypothetical protein
MSNSTAAASDTVVVIVGPEQKRYTLHKRLLEYHSAYFRRAFRGDVSQYNNPTIHAPCFDIVVDWMYEKGLPSYTKTKTGGELLLTYMLAEFLSIGGLKRMSMDKIFDLLSDSRVPGGIVEILFRKLPKNDPLLQLTVDLFCINNGVARMSVDEFADIDNLPKEYLARVIRKQHQLSELPEAKRVLSRGDYSTVICMPQDVAEEE